MYDSNAASGVYDERVVTYEDYKRMLHEQRMRVRMRKMIAKRNDVVRQQDSGEFTVSQTPDLFLSSRLLCLDVLLMTEGSTQVVFAYNRIVYI